MPENATKQENTSVQEIDVSVRTLIFEAAKALLANGAFFLYAKEHYGMDADFGEVLALESAKVIDSFMRVLNHDLLPPGTTGEETPEEPPENQLDLDSDLLRDLDDDPLTDSEQEPPPEAA